MVQEEVVKWFLVLLSIQFSSTVNSVELSSSLTSWLRSSTKWSERHCHVKSYWKASNHPTYPKDIILGSFLVDWTKYFLFSLICLTGLKNISVWVKVHLDGVISWYKRVQFFPLRIVCYTLFYQLLLFRSLYSLYSLYIALILFYCTRQENVPV